MTEQKLSVSERQSLAKCLQAIRKHEESVWEYARAWKTIRDDKLFRATHSTFRAFVDDYADHGRRYIDRLIQSWEAREDASPPGPAGPNSHRPNSVFQARELAKVEPTDRADVWQKAVETAPIDKQGQPAVTADHIAKTRAEHVRAPESDYKDLTSSEDSERELEPLREPNEVPGDKPVDSRPHLARLKEDWIAADLEDRDDFAAWLLEQSGDKCAVCMHPLVRAPKPNSANLTYFDRFWAVVHRKTKRERAQKAFAQAVDRVRQQRDWPTKTAAEHIIGRMIQFASSPQARDDVRGKIHPSTWLNDGCYDDDQETWYEHSLSKSEKAIRDFDDQFGHLADKLKIGANNETRS